MKCIKTGLEFWHKETDRRLCGDLKIDDGKLLITGIPSIVDDPANRPQCVVSAEIVLRRNQSFYSTKGDVEITNASPELRTYIAKYDADCLHLIGAK